VIGGHDLECGDRECCGDRQIDVEDHPPVTELGEEAADEHADCGACASDCSPSRERFRPLAPLERRHDDRKRCGRQERCTETLACASCEEGSRCACHRRRERRCGEDGETGQEHPTTTEQIGGTATEEEQASEDERVAGDGPADVGACELKVFREARQCDVHGRDVEDDHQLGDEQHEQEDAAAFAGGRLGDSGAMLVVCVVPCVHFPAPSEGFRVRVHARTPRFGRK